MTDLELVGQAQKYVPELLAAFRKLLDGLYETHEDRYTPEEADEPQLHDDARQAWEVWRKIAGVEHVPDDVLAMLESFNSPISSELHSVSCREALS